MGLLKTIIPMFPYPSGKLHLGHLRNYMITDCISKFYKLKGNEVLQPFGFDSFGLPAENAAIQHNIMPEIWTSNNIQEMKRQLSLLDLDLDWTTVQTHLPSYYKHTQELFRLLMKNKMAYKKESVVYWDPVDKTVLAREQVIGGKSWRSGAPVEMKSLDQYYLKITDYAEKLLNGLEQLDWPNHVKEMQRNWIGKSIGYEIKFSIDISVYTTRLETICGVLFIAISSEHPLAKALMSKEQKQKVKTWLPNDLTKKGFPLPYDLIHPLNNRKLPVYVANYIENYGTSAVMGVPAEDKRDLEFLKTMESNISIIDIIDTDSQVMNMNNIPEIQGRDFKSAKFILHNLLEDNCKESTVYRLRDWLVSRQRYWGCPIPVINCDNCGIVVDDNFVPLPTMGESDLKTTCPKCKSNATKESDTLDTFVDSSWYYLRYFDHMNKNEIFDKSKIRLPISVYVGGVEHAVMHLLYARFICHFLYDIGMVPSPEPFQKLIPQGMVNGPTYKDTNGKYLQKHEITKYSKMVYEKMSKSKFNGVDPEEMINKYGSDVVKMYLTFRAPVSMEIQWDESQLVGISRWFNKLKKLNYSKCNATTRDNKLDLFVERIITSVDAAYSSMEQLNTIPSDLMKLTNLLLTKENIDLSYDFARTTLFQLMYPIASVTAKSKLKLLEKPLTWPKIIKIEKKSEPEHFKLMYNNKIVCMVPYSANVNFEQILKDNYPEATWKRKIIIEKKKIVNFI